nr:magnesium transporter [Rubritalea profundi]
MSEEAKDTRRMVEAIEERDSAKFLKVADALHYADLAEIFERLNDDKREFFSEHIDKEKFAAVITELPDTLVEETMARLDTEGQREILDQVSDDDRVDILQDVSDDTRERLLALIEPDDIEVTKSLLKYGEHTAGGRMTTHFGSIHAEMTIKEALHSLRGASDETESFSRVYVVDAKERLCGYVRFRDLAFNTWETKISEIQREVTRSILASADQEEAAQMVSKYDLFVLPVVDEQNRILGIITHDDVVEILEEESTEDMEKMAGFSGGISEETYLNTPTMTHFKRRFPWLFGLAILAIASGIVMIKFEHVLESLFILSLFLPMVVAAGGNTGGQASTMVIRAMALGELDEGTLWRVAGKNSDSAHARFLTRHRYGAHYYFCRSHVLPRHARRNRLRQIWNRGCHFNGGSNHFIYPRRLPSSDRCSRGKNRSGSRRSPSHHHYC